MAGRKPKPTHLKLVEGNRGKRKTNPKEPKPKRERPSPPGHLPADVVVHWGYFSEMADGMGVLTRPDAVALERVCMLYAELLALDTLLSTEVHFYKVGDMTRAHPALAYRADVDRRFQSWCKEFGFTPSSRTKVQSIGQDGHSDPSEAYFG